jgi:hypothetical protein
MLERVRAHNKPGANKGRQKRRPKAGTDQDDDTSPKSEPAATYPCSFVQLIGMAIRDKDYTRRLIAIFSLIVLAVLLGLAIVALALREVHVSNRIIWPVGIAGSAAAIVAALGRAVAGRFRRGEKPEFSDGEERDSG